MEANKLKNDQANYDKNKYFASFAAGMQLIIKNILEKQIPDVHIFQLFDGAVLFETWKTYDRLNMYCFNNIFSVITFAPKKNCGIESFIEQIINSRLQNRVISDNNKDYHTFRLIISFENKLISINNMLKNKLEKLISSQSKLAINRSNPDAEFWILYRTEGFYYFMKRLTRHNTYDKILNKGELHPEIAFIMNWLTEPDKNDIILDPFCGNGAIPLKRALNFPTKQVYAFDIDKTMVYNVKKKIAKKKSLAKMKNIIVKQVDIKYIEKELSQESIDKIVTDPPWGLYENIKMDINDFYNLVLFKFEKVLKINGIIVLLISRNINIEILIESFPNLLLENIYNVLISGKKANLVKLIKLKIN
jgi:tRNA G10  N-methylase Trm11